MAGFKPGSVCPADGRPLAPVLWATATEVGRAVDQARQAWPRWRDRTIAERRKGVLALAKRILEHRDEAIDVLGDEMGRGQADSLLTELTVALDYAKGACRLAEQALAPERVKLSPLNFPKKRAVIEAVPRGVVGLITPWNYPLMQIYRPLFHALLAGNAVVIKPSEHTPRTALWLGDQARAVLPEGLVQVVTGGGEAGAALVEAPIDALVFTGSVATGRRVAARMAERLIPCSVELGGKDAAIVLADCDLGRTVLGIAHWALHNAGQDCSSIERVYVENAIADAFVDRLAVVVSRLRVSPCDGHPDLGPLQNEAQLRRVQEHIADAVEHGARVVVGGTPTGRGFGLQPTVLDGCHAGMRVIQEETFGPVVPVVRVADAEEAVAQANASSYGLNGSIWTRDLQRGEQLARRLEVGVALVNNHSFVGVVPQVPWTGVKQTGPGVAGSRYAYDLFARRRTVVVDGNRAPEVFWFPADQDLLELGHAVSDLALGMFGRVFRLLPLLSRRSRTLAAMAKGKA